jgi:hypothetical protein
MCATNSGTVCSSSDHLEIRYRYKVKGEKFGCHRVEVLKQFPFPEIDGMRFIPEGVVWSKIARRYKTKCVNEILRTYYIEDHDSDQLTKVANPAKHALGNSIHRLTVINDSIDWFFYKPLFFLRTAAQYVRFSLHGKVSVPGQISKAQHLFAKILIILMLPVGIGVFLRDRYRLAVRNRQNVSV